MNSEKAIWRAITEVVTVEQLNEITSRVLHQRERPTPSEPAAPEPTWWEKEEAKTNQEFRDYAHRFGAKPGDNIFDFVMRDAMTYRDQQPVMKCRSCGASTQEYKPVLRSHGLICIYCGAMLVDRVEPAAPAEAVPAAEAHPDHDYTSTACIHGVHNRCRQQCKFCSVKCGCICHAMQQLDRSSSAPQPPTNTPDCQGRNWPQPPEPAQDLRGVSR